MDTPKQILELSKHMSTLGSGHVERIGTWRNFDVFSYVFDEDVTIGLPEFYLWDGKQARLVDGVDALSIDY